MPPTGVMALSISAADVPYAKFLAMTMYGPAIPRIDNPLDTGVGATTLNWELRAGDEADPFRAERIRSLRRVDAGFGPRVFG
jgi:hypothetical protein